MPGILGSLEEDVSRIRRNLRWLAGVSQHFQMEWEYTRAENGNIAFTGEIDLAACNGEFVFALGFGAIWTEAGQQARSTLVRGLRRDSAALRVAVAKLARHAAQARRAEAPE